MVAGRKVSALRLNVMACSTEGVVHKEYYQTIWQNNYTSSIAIVTFQLMQAVQVVFISVAF